MRKLLFAFAAFIVLNGCGNQSSSDKSTIPEQVAKSEVQKKTEHFMNTKSDLLHMCENMYAIYKDDKFRIYLSEWNDTPIDTIFKSDLYQILIEDQRELLTWAAYDESLMQKCEEEQRLRQERGIKSVFDDSDLESRNRRRRHERDSINGIITRIQNQSDWNEPYWLIYEFVEDVERTFSISGETDKAKYPCYSIYKPSSEELVSVVENAIYSKPHVLKLLKTSYYKEFPQSRARIPE